MSPADARALAKPLALVLMTLAISTPPARAAKRDACEDLAFAFYTIAEYERRGDSRESQLAWLHDHFGERGSSGAANVAERIIEFVYRSEAQPEQIGRQVLEHCVVDREGRAVVRMSRQAR